MLYEEQEMDQEDESLPDYNEPLDLDDVNWWPIAWLALVAGVVLTLAVGV